MIYFSPYFIYNNLILNNVIIFYHFKYFIYYMWDG